MNLYVRIQVKLSAAEIDGASVGVTFMQLRDSILGHTVGLRYDHVGSQWQVFSDVGQIINVPEVLVDAFSAFLIHALVQVDGKLKIVVWHQQTRIGEFLTPTPWHFDAFRIGAMDNTGGELVDHYFAGVFIGSQAGQHDVFNTNNFSATTVVPPFDSVFGGTFSIVTQSLHVVNSGDTTAYAHKQIATVVVPVGTGLVDPGDANIVIVGDTDWKMAGQPAWVLDHWGLDRLIVPMRGSRRSRDEFLASLTPWMPFPADLNMFLADITQEQHGGGNFPRIDLIFTGKRNGLLPPIREQAGEQIQQISGRSIFNTTHTLSVTFVSKTAEQTVWSRTPIDLSTVSPLQPANLDLMWLVETDVVIWSGTFEAFQSILNTNVSACFVARVVWTGVSEEIVPGQYYRATKTNQRLLFPVLG